MNFIESLAKWCQEQIETRRQALELMEEGVIQTRQRHPNGTFENTTPKSIADNRREITELQELLEKIKRDRPG